MSNTIESKGRSVEEAIREALLRTGWRRDEVDVTVLDQPKRGILGLGSRPARVKVERKGGGERRGRRDEGRRDDARRGRGGRERDQRGGRGADIRAGEGRSADGASRGRSEGRRDARGEPRGETRGETRGESREEGRGEPRDRDRRGRGGRDRDRDRDRARPEGAVATERPRDPDRPRDPERSRDGEGSRDGDAGRSRRRRRRPGRPQEGDPRLAQVAAAETAASLEEPIDAVREAQAAARIEERQDLPEVLAESPETGPAPAPDVAPPVQVAATAAPAPREATARTVRAVERVAPYGRPEGPVSAFLQTVATDLMRYSGFPCRCEVREGEYDLVKLVTDDRSAAVLIGRHGTAIDAVEHLVEKMASQARGERVLMNLDINNYRRRREEHLVQVARGVIREVRETGKPVHLDPLCARERRIIHLQVMEAEGLATYTVADENGKHVVVTTEEDARTAAAAGGGEHEGHDEDLARNEASAPLPDADREQA